jgi:acetyl-CoA synthetase
MSVDLIRSAGHEVDPLAVEQRLLEHPAVLEAAVVGRPDAVRGEMVKAFVVLRPGTPADESIENALALFMESRVPLHALPREIEFVERLPRNHIGEVERELLRTAVRKGVL